eukprot:scaffold80309_cov72-Phaeocystis_antarctica.AAC.5
MALLEREQGFPRGAATAGRIAGLAGVIQGVGASFGQSWPVHHKQIYVVEAKLLQVGLVLRDGLIVPERGAVAPADFGCDEEFSSRHTAVSNSTPHFDLGAVALARID